MPILVKNGRVYSSTSSGSSIGGGSVEMTQAQYNALQNPDPNIIYFITDGTAGYPSADDIEYNNTTSELTADNVQDAIDENILNIKNLLTTETKSITLNVPSDNALSWSISSEKNGYTPIMYTLYHNNSTTVMFDAEGVTMSNGSFAVNGFSRRISGSGSLQTNFSVRILWMKNI